MFESYDPWPKPKLASKRLALVISGLGKRCSRVGKELGVHSQRQALRT